MDGESPAKVGSVEKEEMVSPCTLFGISYLVEKEEMLLRSHLALYVNCHRVGELEGVEESVSDDGRPRVGPGDLHELADHFGPEDAAVLVAQLDRLRILCIRRAGLDSHVKLACAKRSSSSVILVNIISKRVSEVKRQC